MNFNLSKGEIIGEVEKSTSTLTNLNYVVSFSTIPPRFKNINNVVKGLMKQTIKPSTIYINIPHKYNRFPNWDQQLPDISKYKNVKILRGKDYGPASKLMHVLKLADISENMPIVICDDDFILSPTICEQLVGACLTYNCASTNCSFPSYRYLTIPREVYNINSYNKEPYGLRGIQEGYVDMLEGWAGYCVTKKMFAQDFFSFPFVEAMMVDDIWVSGHIIKNGGYIYSIPYTTSKQLDAPEPLCGNSDVAKNNDKVIKYMQKKYGIWNSKINEFPA